nr:MAG TPA: hypothetical protein [Caudoviricetes sp.]
MTEKERLEDLLTMHCFLKERGLAIAEQAEKDIEETKKKLLTIESCGEKEVLRKKLLEEGEEATKNLQAICDLVYGKGRAKVEITVSVDADKPIFSKKEVAVIKECLDFRKGE